MRGVGETPRDPRFELSEGRMLSLTRRHVAASSAALLAGCATQTQTAATAPAAPAAPAAPHRDRRLGRRSHRARYEREAGRRFLQIRKRHLDRATPIPADRTRWGAFDILREKSDADVKAIIEELVAQWRRAGLERAEGRGLLQFLHEHRCDRASRASRRSRPTSPPSPRCARKSRPFA